MNIARPRRTSRWRGLHPGRSVALFGAALLTTGLISVPAATAATPSLRVLDLTVTERNATGLVANVKVQLSAPPTRLVKVDYTTVNGTAKSPADYAARSGTLNFRVGQGRTKVVAVPIKGDLLDEANETFKVRISNPYRASISDAVGLVTINDNDALPQLSAADVEVYEGSDGAANVTMPVTLAAASGRQVTVPFSVTPGSATYGSDYTLTPTTGSLVFPPGTVRRDVTVSVIGDTTDETAETLNLSLLSPSNALLVDGTAVLRILDDDGPGIAMSNATMASEPGTATFTVTIPAPGSPETVTVNYATANGTATSPSDYTATSGTVTFAPFDTSETITVSVAGDSLDEVDEYFFVNLSNPSGGAALGDPQGYAYIDDNDGPTIRVNDPPAAAEGAAATFTVTLSAASPQQVQVHYATSSGSATSGADFTSKSGTLTFVPGDTSEQVSVLTADDVVFEGDEYFYLDLSSPTDATIADSWGVTYINGNPTTAKATYLGSFRGDTGGDYTTSSSSLTLGDTDMYRFEIRESLFGILDDDLTMHANLVVNEGGGDLDMCVYNSGGGLMGCSSAGGTTDEAYAYGWDDSNSNDTRTFYVLVKPYGSVTNGYTLRVGR